MRAAGTKGGPEDSTATPANRRAQRRSDSEARILAAAEQIFAETGFSGATTAMIAAKARLPKANLHYYFGTKERLYRAVLRRILEAWLASGDGIRADAEPGAAFADYISAKIEASRRQPYASKVFANEILHGAPQLDDYLRGQVHRWVQEKAKVIDRWVAAGKMQPVAAPHLFFVLWAATQTYADFECQMRAVLKRRRLAPADYAAGTELITRMVLGACGIRNGAGRTTRARQPQPSPPSFRRPSRT
jgi:TetR/AcrR family transcriptional regulator